MQHPEIPSNENERLAALSTSEINHVSNQDQLQKITQIALKVFDVSIAYISSISSSKQFIHASCGMDMGTTDRSASFCGHTILQDDVFTIPDTMKDERFVDNPLVVGGPKIRFYAGCPLNSVDGYKIGSLCIADQNPRKLKDSETETLIDLASIVEDRLKLLKQLKDQSK